MIVYDLSCANSHRFEVWFRSGSDYAEQREKGWLQCPDCGSAEVSKAPMAPAVPAKGNARTEFTNSEENSAPVSGGAGEESLPPKLVEAMKALAKVQAETIKDSTWVGKDFARQSREMHYGDRHEALIHGKATAEEAKELADEGINVAPLLIPVSDPDELN